MFWKGEKVENHTIQQKNSETEIFCLFVKVTIQMLFKSKFLGIVKAPVSDYQLQCIIAMKRKAIVL